MKNLIIIAFLSFYSVSLRADWTWPDEPPAISAIEAITLSQEHVDQNEDYSKDYYVEKVWCAVLPDDSKRSWTVVFASPSSGYLFLVVYMDGKVVNPKKIKKRFYYSRLLEAEKQ